jgi:hypothetical protein
MRAGEHRLSAGLERTPVKLPQALPCALVALMTAACTPPTPNAASQVPDATPTAATPATPAAPAHAWTFHQNGVYGYESAISDNDRAAGVLAKPMTLVMYGGKTGDKYSFTQRVQPGFNRMMSCTEPCAQMVVETYGGGTIDQQVIAVADGSILSEILNDARNGQLQPYAETR